MILLFRIGCEVVILVYFIYIRLGELKETIRRQD
jgi:hypothetical protein